MSPRARRRGRTRKSMGERPSTSKASISSLAFMLPRVEAKAPAGQYDRRHHRAHFPNNGKAHYVGDEDIGAELPQFDGRLIGEGEADQKTDQADDRKGHRAALLHLVKAVAPAELVRAPGKPHGAQDAFTHKVQDPAQIGRRMFGRKSDRSETAAPTQ